VPYAVRLVSWDIPRWKDTISEVVCVGGLEEEDGENGIGQSLSFLLFPVLLIHVLT
jgi:hypothetical protein